MDRRAFLAGVGAAIGVGIPARAAVQCGPSPVNPYVQACRAEVDFRAASQVYAPQAQSQWCWAASVAMIFAHAGYRVAQERIVAETYGQIVNMPAGNGFMIAQQVARDWVDDTGRRFTVSLQAAYDYDAGVYQLNNAIIAEALARNQPLILGARAHAMVLTLMDYAQTPMGPQVTGMGVFDPWPGIGPRGLFPDEMVAMNMGGSLRFIALPRFG